MKNIQNIKNLIAKDKLGKAVHEILAITRKSDNDHYNSAVILSSDLCSFEKAKINGLLRWEDESREKRNITVRMLKLLDKIQLDLSTKKSNRWKKLLQYLFNPE